MSSFYFNWMQVMAARDAAVAQMAVMSLAIVLAWVLRGWILQPWPSSWRPHIERFGVGAGLGLYLVTVLVALRG